MKSHRAKLVALLVAIAGVGAVAIYELGDWLQDGRDPQGGSNASCDDFELPAVRSGAGMIVSSHMTVCTTLGTDVGTYVHVHHEGQARGRSSLAFRFSPADGAEPQVEWIDNSSVRITVSHVSQVTKMRSQVGGVKLQYVIGKQDYPPALDAAEVQ